METKQVPAATVALLAVGPILSVLTVLALPATNGGGTWPVWAWLAAVLVVWSPLPISLPAVMLDTYRDSAAATLKASGKKFTGTRLLPAMIAGSASVATVVSLASFVIALAIAWVPLTTLANIW